ncbi:MAG: hypothetical protein AAFY76_26770, partial [Cyanobacteria bacterium J06649_11]
LIEAVRDDFNQRYGLSLTSRNILITPGSQNLYFLAANALGGYNTDGQLKDIVLPLSPDYTGYGGVTLYPEAIKAYRPAIELGQDAHSFKYRPDFDQLTINQNTGFETGATWTTLNGYDNHLKLEVKQKAVICGLFFDVNNSDNNGSIKLSITSNKPYFNPQELTIASKENCYILNESYLSSLKQSGQNLVELKPGNYKIRIQSGNASYWSDDKKFNLEPWALIWAKGGKFTTKLAGVEVEESWCSLNGLKDEIILEVKEKTSVTGFFFDTYKEDNEGQIVLAIEPINAAELNSKRQQLQQQAQFVTSSAGTTNGNTRTKTTTNGNGGKTTTTTTTT